MSSTEGMLSMFSVAMPHEKNLSCSRTVVESLSCSTKNLCNVGSSLTSPMNGSSVSTCTSVAAKTGMWSKHSTSCNGNSSKKDHASQNQKSSKAPDSKLVVLGSAAVGKSALVVRFITKRFIWEYDPTLECSYRYSGHVDDEQTCIEILDTAGQGNSFQQEGNIRWGDGFLLVYSITDRTSFEEVSRNHQLVLNIRRTNNVSFVIIGNKTDLSHERKVSYREGEQLALEFGCAFMECSACDGDREVYEGFWELHRDVVRRRSALGRRRRSSAQQVIQVFNKVLTKING